MSYGVCHLSVIPMRGEPSEKAEMVSQLLFGEAYEVIEEKKEWLKIKTVDCEYEGWINVISFNLLHELDVENYLNAPKYILRELLFFIKDFETNITFPIFAGSSFPYPQEEMLILGDAIFLITLPEEILPKPHPSLSQERYNLLRFSSLFLEAPYLWGGRTHAGIDCSAFVQLAYKSVGTSLPRDASQQAQLGETVDFIHEAQPGDVAFFQNEEGNITHTGIITGLDKIIHASGKVKINTIDSTGIFDKKQGRYTHFLRIIKRFLP